MTAEQHRTAPFRFAPVLASALLVLVACGGNGGGGEAGSGEVAGVIGGETITVAELDAYIKDELFERESQGGTPAKVYELRQREFQRMANDRLIAAEAAAQNLEPEALLRREGERDLAVDEAQVRALYDQNRAQLGDQSFEAIAPRIRAHLRNQQAQRNAQLFLQGLREEAGVRFELEQVRVEVAGSGPSLGNDDAPITIVEFSDYECPYCKRAESIVEGVLARYPDRVRFEYRHFPLEEIHPRARPAAEAASCAEAQGRFWEFHKLIFEGAPELADDDLRGHAEVAGLDLDAYDACVAERSGRDRVDEDLAHGQAAHVSGTPTFFVNGIPVTGGGSVDDFAKLIDAELERLRSDS